MGMHQNSMFTGARGLWLDVIRFTFPATMTVNQVATAGIESLGSQYVKSITKIAVGQYRVQLDKAFPAAITGLQGNFAFAATPAVRYGVELKKNSYTATGATAGSFDIFITTLSGATTWAAADPAIGVQLCLEIHAQKYASLQK